MRAMTRNYLSAVAAVGDGLGSHHGWLIPPPVVSEIVLQRGRVRSRSRPVARIAPLVPLVPHGLLAPEGLARVEIRGFPGGVNPESDANGRADLQTHHGSLRLVASAGAAFAPIPEFTVDTFLTAVAGRGVLQGGELRLAIERIFGQQVKRIPFGSQRLLDGGVPLANEALALFFAECFDAAVIELQLVIDRVGRAEDFAELIGAGIEAAQLAVQLVGVVGI